MLSVASPKASEESERMAAAVVERVKPIEIETQIANAPPNLTTRIITWVRKRQAISASVSAR
jgi:hypothetical protein